MTEWKVNDAYMLTPNNQSESTEYMFNDLAIKMGDQFKVVYAEAGKEKIWYPAGVDNNYGQNGEFTTGGLYTVYFRPNSDGGEGWFCNCIYVVCTMTDAAMAVNGQISALPEATDVTGSDKAAVTAAREAYDALNDADKAFVDPALLQKLTDVEARINSFVLLGDVDGDGDVTVVDVTFIQRSLASIDLPGTFDSKAADIDRDDEVTVVDATFIQRYLADMNTAYPIGEYV